MPEVPQSGMINAAYISPHSAHFNILLPGIGLSLGHSGFSWSDLVRRQADDSLYIDAVYALEQLKRDNHLYFNTFYEPLSFGMRFRRHYISFTSRTRLDMSIRYPDVLFKLITSGNASFIGEEIKMGGIGVLGAAWQENSVGWAMNVNDGLNVGIRAKFLNGMAGIHLAHNNSNFTTGEHMYEIHAESDFILHTSYPSDSVFTLPWNPGYAFDIGIKYRFDERLSVQAGLNDIGRIYWNENLISYRSKDSAMLSYSGFEINDFLNAGIDFEAELVSFLDTLEVVFGPIVSVESFSTQLPANFHLSVCYQFKNWGSLNAMLYLRHLENILEPSFGIMYHHYFGRVFSASTSVAYHNRSMANFGLGCSLTLGFFQMYLMSGNLLPVFIPHKAKNAGFRFGFNFFIGRHEM